MQVEYYDIECGDEIVVTIKNWRLGLKLDEWIIEHYGQGWKRANNPSIRPVQNSITKYQLTVRIKQG